MLGICLGPPDLEALFINLVLTLSFPVTYQTEIEFARLRTEITQVLLRIGAEPVGK